VVTCLGCGQDPSQVTVSLSSGACSPAPLLGETRSRSGERYPKLTFLQHAPYEVEIFYYFAPLTRIEALSTRVQGPVLIVDMSLSVNFSSPTIEQVGGVESWGLGRTPSGGATCGEGATIRGQPLRKDLQERSTCATIAGCGHWTTYTVCTLTHLPLTTHTPLTNERELPFLMNRPATNLGLTVANLSLMNKVSLPSHHRGSGKKRRSQQAPSQARVSLPPSQLPPSQPHMVTTVCVLWLRDSKEYIFRSDGGWHQTLCHSPRFRLSRLPEHRKRKWTG